MRSRLTDAWAGNCLPERAAGEESDEAGLPCPGVCLLQLLLRVLLRLHGCHDLQGEGDSRWVTGSYRIGEILVWW